MRARPILSILDPTSFDAIADLAYRESGLTLVREKSTMVQSRLRHRLRALGLRDFAQYSAFVHSDQGTGERRHLINALTTNVSHFFREPHHFGEMCAHVRDILPDLRAGGRLRIWSAGCSNGQEPLSAAIALLEEIPEVAQFDLRILATDIDGQVIRFARMGCYPQRLLTGLPDTVRDRYFTLQSTIGSELFFKAHPKIISIIRYNELNLLGKWPMKHSFDIILCRNVVIYFDLPTQEVLWPRFHHALGPTGVLFLGHSERIASPQAHQFICIGPTTYRKASTQRSKKYGVT